MKTQVVNRDGRAWGRLMASALMVLMLGLMTTGCDRKSKSGTSIGGTPGGPGSGPGGCYDDYCYGGTELLASAIGHSTNPLVRMEIGLNFYRTDGGSYSGSGDFEGGALAEGYIYVDSDSDACNSFDSKARIRRGFYNLYPKSSSQWSDTAPWNMVQLPMEAVHESGRKIQLTLLGTALKTRSMQIGKDGYEYPYGMLGAIRIDSVSGVSCNLWGMPLNVFFEQ